MDICAVSGSAGVPQAACDYSENSFCARMFLYLSGKFTRGETALTSNRYVSNYKKVKVVLSDGDSSHFTPLQKWVLSVILILPFR